MKKSKRYLINWSFSFLLIPIICLPYHFKWIEETDHHFEHKAVIIDDMRVVLIEEKMAKPFKVFGGGYRKDYEVKISKNVLDKIKIVTLYVNSREQKYDIKTHAIAHGNPYELHAHVPFSDTLKDDDKLWLEISYWNNEKKILSWNIKDVITHKKD